MTDRARDELSGLIPSMAAIGARSDTIALMASRAGAYGAQHHRDFSPIGWHRGHVASVWAHWILVRCAGQHDAIPPGYDALFSPVVTPKAERAGRLPSHEEIERFVREVRERVREFLTRPDAVERAPELLADGRIVRFLVGHEEQHAEIQVYVLALAGLAGEGMGRSPSGVKTSWEPYDHGAVTLPEARVRIGTDEVLDAYDNERGAHEATVGAFALDVHAASNAHLAAFVRDGGYRTRSLWTDEGWAFREREGLVGPRYWGRDPLGHAHARLDPMAPAERLSLHEARAYARWAGGRLPTELEWERAARWDDATGRARRYPWGDEPPSTARAVAFALEPSRVDGAPGGVAACGCHGMAGGVWEWTDTAFAPYPGFAAWPYEGYSTPYFDGAHFVLRGGSWASYSNALRATFRNWYVAGTTEVFAGVRVARDV